jgi:Flp pilus assembly protein TadG
MTRVEYEAQQCPAHSAWLLPIRRTATAMPAKTLRRTIRSGQSGSSTVELALIAPILLLLLIAVIEFGLLFWANLTMQHAVREGARYAVTGRSDLDPNIGSQQRYLAIIQKIKDSSMGLYDRIDPVISVNNGTRYGNVGSYSSTMFGGPGDILVVRLDCTWPVFTPLLTPFFTDGKYRFSVAATMRNEAFL